MSIDEAVRVGLAIHPQVRAAESDVRAADTDVKVAKGGYYPSVSVSGGPRSLDLDGLSYEVTAAQMLYDWGRVSSKVENARAAKRQLSEDMLVKRDAAALDIAETYLDVLVTERLIAADNLHIERLREILEMTEIRSEGGYADRSEPERANLELARAQEQLVTDQGQLADARSQFETLVGTAATALDEPAPQSMSHYIETSDLAVIIADAPLYQKAVEDTKIAYAELRDTRSSLLPQLNVEATTMRRDIGGRAQSDSTIALRFRMNSFQGFSNFQRVSGARQRIESAQWREGAVQREIRREVRNLLDTDAMIQAREETLRKQVTDSTSIGSLYREQFAVGRRDVIDLLNVQRERFEAERQIIDIHVQRIRIQYQVATKLGLIGPLLEGGLAG